MTVQSDATIKYMVAVGHLGIDPYDARRVQPASYDVALGPTLLVPAGWHEQVDLGGRRPDDLFESRTIGPKGYRLRPGGFVLGATAERITIPPDLLAQVNGKSSLGRLGLLVHATAGFVDPGWDGCLTLELVNVFPVALVLHAGMPIAQLSFSRLSNPAERPYGSDGLSSRYRGDTGPVASRWTWESGVDVPEQEGLA